MNKKASLATTKLLAIGIGITFILIALLLSISNSIQIHKLRNEVTLYQESIAALNTQITNLTSQISSLEDKVENYKLSMDTIKDDTKVEPDNAFPEESNTSNIMPESYDVQVTAVEGLRVRREPNLNSDIITVIPYQTIVTITDDHKTSWYKTNNAELYENGYIFKDYTTTDIREVETPVVRTMSSDTTTMSITEPSNLSAEEFDAIIETFANDRSITNSALIGTGEALVALEENYNFNGLFALSVAGLESGFGITNAATKYNNPLGIMGGGKITVFDSTHDAFNTFGKFMSKNYLESGRTTISSIGAKYCPSTATKWAEDVTWFWNKLTAYA